MSPENYDDKFIVDAKVYLCTIYYVEHCFVFYEQHLLVLLLSILKYILYQNITFDT